MRTVREEICRKIDGVLNRLTYANSSMHIISSINQFSTENGAVPVLSRDVNFWIVVLDNCGYRVYAELANVYESSSQTAGLKYLLNFCEQNYKQIFLEPQRAPLIIKELKQKYSETSDLQERLKAIRDQGLFHLDKHHALDLHEFVRNESLSYKEKNMLIHVAEEICNTLLENIKGERKSIELCLNDDARYILEDLKKQGDK